ncbi:MAG: molybdopterin-guanine dinucleotide biosynthesis protein MobB [Gammaproteobacteria bacterium]|jgi:molybdopterin-guanine dinucleotide biosynthesis protein MobB
MISTNIPIVGFSAFSGTGKTTLLKQIIPLLKQRKLRLAVVKHAHHHFELDQPGKDSYEIRKSGADHTIICTTTRMAQITEFPTPEQEPSLQEIVNALNPNKIDLVLVEGYKHIPFTKIELHRSELKKPYLHPDDPSIVAIACDAPLPGPSNIAVLDINDIQRIAQFIYQRIYLKTS